MVCSECGNPLKVVRGGIKTVADSPDIVMVHVYGCMNEQCTKAMQEQLRTESIVEQFTE